MENSMKRLEAQLKQKMQLEESFGKKEEVIAMI